MARSLRFSAPGLAYHVTQRGNYRQNIFEDERDKQMYMDCFEDYCLEYGMKVYAWCLMSNHVHFIVEPEKEDSLSKVFQFTNMRYSHYFNKKKGSKGHLWQGRFYSIPLDEEHLYEGIRYVELNPLRAKMVNYVNEYYWSSSWYRLRGEESFKLDDFSDHVLIEKEWKDYLQGDCDEEIIKRIRKHTLSGKAIAKTSTLD